MRQFVASKEATLRCLAASLAGQGECKSFFRDYQVFVADLESMRGVLKPTAVVPNSVTKKRVMVRRSDSMHGDEAVLRRRIDGDWR